MAVPRAVHAAVVVYSLVLFLLPFRRRNRVAFLLLLFFICGIVVAVPLFPFLVVFVLLLVGRIGVGLILIFLFLLLGLFLLLALPPEREIYVYKS